jgi:hypothetical protein
MREMSISGEEFLRRYLQHILPKGFVRLRYYGLLHPYWSEELEKIRIENGEEEVEEEEEVKETGAECKDCKLPLVTIAKVLPWFGRREKRGRKFYIFKSKYKKGEVDGLGNGCPAYNKADQPDYARPSRYLLMQIPRR